jgi:hypothetical protein
MRVLPAADWALPLFQAERKPEMNVLSPVLRDQKVEKHYRSLLGTHKTRETPE